MPKYNNPRKTWRYVDEFKALADRASAEQPQTGPPGDAGCPLVRA